MKQSKEGTIIELDPDGEEQASYSAIFFTEQITSHCDYATLEEAGFDREKTEGYFRQVFIDGINYAKKHGIA